MKGAEGGCDAKKSQREEDGQWRSTERRRGQVMEGSTKKNISKVRKRGEL